MSEVSSQTSDEQDSMLSSGSELSFFSLDSDSDEEDLFAFVDDAVSYSSRTATAGLAERDSTCIERAGRASLCGISEAPLYPGSQLSTFQSYLLVFQYSIRHSLTTKAFSELLKLLSVHLPEGQSAAVPRSVHSLKRLFLDAVPGAQTLRHFYCSCCQRAISDGEICSGAGCSGGKPAAFITIPLAPQIKRMMEDPTCWTALQRRFQQGSGHGLRDIYDGEGYKQHASFLSHPSHISLLLNTDGVAIFRSSSVSIWPVWAVVNELPPTLRFQRQYMLLLAIFYSSDKPTTNIFLRPFVDDINKIYRDGVEVETPDGIMLAHAILLGLSVDLPARAMVMNMKQWNGVCGCLYCEDKGVVLDGSHLHRYWPLQSASVARTHASLLANAETATRTKTAVWACGVKGPTVLALHPFFNLAEGVVIDDLHGIYLGVTLSLLRNWFDKNNRGKPYFIGNKLRECDERLLSIQVTDSMSRVPKSLEDFSHWKGAELRSWLLFYSLPVLREILPREFLSHLALLVAAIYIYSQEYISEECLLTARLLLRQFYHDFSTLYGIKATTMNVHMLSHLPDCVRLWGPLWAYSCFHFENLNGYLKFLFHGTRDMTKQMAFSYVLMQTLPSTLPALQSCSNAVSTVANTLYGKKTVNKQSVGTGVNVLGGVILKPVLPSTMNGLVSFLICNMMEPPQEDRVTTLYRVEIHGTVYYSQQYQRMKKRNSYTISYFGAGRGKKFGLIQFFLYIHKRAIAVIKPLFSLSITCKDHFQLTTTAIDSYIHTVNVDSPPTGESHDFCFVEDIIAKCLFFDFTQVKYVLEFPSSLTFD